MKECTQPKWGTRTDITHIKGIPVMNSWPSSVTINGGHWVLLTNGDLWMTDGSQISLNWCENPNNPTWLSISDVTGHQGKDLFV